MTEKNNPIEAALRSGSRSKNYGRKISDMCRDLSCNPDEISAKQRAAIVKLAALCRATRAISAILKSEAVEDIPAIESVPEFGDLFCESYYPVLEDGKRTVGFWSVKDSATLTPDDVHEWVRDSKIDKKTGKREIVPVPFGSWWSLHRPDYDIYGVASDRSKWQQKVVEAGGRKCVNMAYGMPPVLSDAPKGYGDGEDAASLLNAILERVITDPDPSNALRKQHNFVLDAGAHLLHLRDGGTFRCRKVFCFTSTNAGQGTGKSFLHESIAALVPRDASCTVPTTCLADTNLLPLYAASVCILTEAPSTSTDRYTAEDVKAFADAGWKTATEKFIAKRAVCDNSLKLLSSNHLSPLPIDSARSRRIEFFVAASCDDGGASLRKVLDAAQVKNKWSCEEMRACVGWALLQRAGNYLEDGAVPFPVARRTIAAKHLLSPSDLDFFESYPNATQASYNDYRDFRTDLGISWSPDKYKFMTTLEMSMSNEIWIDDAPMPIEPLDPPTGPSEPTVDEQQDGSAEEGEDSGADECEEPASDAPKAITLQYKRRMATAYLEEGSMGFGSLYAYIVGDKGLKESTLAVRAGTADKKLCLRQVFPGATFERFTRTESIVGWTGLTHVDFDHIAENGNGLTPEQVRDALAELPGFVIGAVSSRANGAWAIFNAGDSIKDYDTYLAAERSLFRMCEERVCMKCDEALRLPTAGRTLAHDPDCRISDEGIAGMLPEPYPWKAPTFAVKNVRLMPSQQTNGTTADEAIRNEKFLEKVVETSCEKIQTAAAGERHDTAIKAVANVTFCCAERGVQPLASWGRRLRDACNSIGLEGGEVNSIMAYWKQRTGLAG